LCPPITEQEIHQKYILCSGMESALIQKQKKFPLSPELETILTDLKLKLKLFHNLKYFSQMAANGCDISRFISP
jgi:hypothetical protein